MADFRISLGGTISAATTDEVDGLLGKHFDANKPPRSVKPIMRPLTGSVAGGAFTTGATVQIKLGRPASGRIWVVTRITVLGEDDVTTHTNMLASVFVGNEQTLDLGQCVRSGVSIPWTTTENERAYPVHDREDLVVKFTAVGATTVPNFVVNGMAWDYPDWAIDAQAI